MLESFFENEPLQISDIQEMDNEKLGLMDVVRLELCFTGLIPSQAIVSNRWRLKLFRWYQNIILCVYVPVMVGQMLAIYHFWGDVDTVTDCAGTFFAFVACFFDYLYLIEHENGVLHVCELLEGNPYPKVDTPHLVKKYLNVVDGCRREIRIVMRCFWGLAALGAVKWLIYNPVMDLIVEPHFLRNKTAAIDDKPDADFVFIIWFPFDATWSPLFEVVYMFQSVLLVMAACHNICANSTFITFMVHAWGKLEIAESTIECMEEELNPERFKAAANSEGNDDELSEPTTEENMPSTDSTEETGLSGVEGTLNGSSRVYPTEGDVDNDQSGDANERIDTLLEVSNDDLESDEPEKDEPFLYLVKCIKQHQAGIEFVEALDHLVSSWLAVRLFAFQMVAIGEVFQIIVTLDDWEQCTRHFITLLLILSQILMYCSFGEQVLQGGWDVDRAVYATPWYTYSQKYKKHLVLVIMRAHRPVEITVGHYYSLSLQSCELIIQNIYFFSMFLNQISNKSKNAALKFDPE